MAMSWIWAALLALGLGFGLRGGADLSGAVLAGTRKAVETALPLAGSLCLWSGFAEVLQRSGLTDRLGRLLSPLLGRLFPTARRDPETMGAVCGNFTANLLGLGSAATPPGIRAAARMQALSGGTRATDEMCRLVVLNTASIQLLPATAAALRAGLGSARPFDILPAVWVTSGLSVAAGLLAARLLGRVWR